MKYPIKLNELREELCRQFDVYLKKVDERERNRIGLLRQIFNVIVFPHDCIDEKIEKSLYYGFSFFVSRGVNFDYNLGYLFHKVNAYMEFLQDYNKHISEICNHYNSLLRDYPSEAHKFIVVYDECFSFTSEIGGGVKLEFNPSSFLNNIHFKGYVVQGYIKTIKQKDPEIEAFYTCKFDVLNAFDWEKFVKLSNIR